MANLSIYVGTYKKYNEGSLFGKWIYLNEFTDYEELLNEMKQLHKDEKDPEFMFQDFEYPKLFEELDLISESYISKEIFDVLEVIENCNFRIEILEAYCYCMGYNDGDIYELINKVEESYNGEYDNDIHFVSNLLEGCGDLPQNLPNYIHIDWEKTAWNIMLDYSTSNNYYFRNL